jgi:hypothetical protein
MKNDLAIRRVHSRRGEWSIEVKEYLREIKNMDAAECRAPSLTQRCADAGDASLDLSVKG